MTSVSRFLIGALLTALLSGGALAAALRAMPSADAGWAGTGFLAMALPIVATGAWLVLEHGRTGASFVLAMGTGLVLRTALLAVVVAVAARRGSPELAGALSGAAAGFVPLIVFELLWLARRVRRAAVPAKGNR